MWSARSALGLGAQVAAWPRPLHPLPPWWVQLTLAAKTCELVASEVFPPILADAGALGAPPV